LKFHFNSDTSPVQGKINDCNRCSKRGTIENHAKQTSRLVIEKSIATLREEILADQPIRQFRRNLAEFVLAEGRIMNLFMER